MKVVIDGRSVLGEDDLHRRLAGALGYGPLYRPGPAALRERLAAGDPRPLELTLVNATTVRLALGRAVFDELIAMLEEIEAADEGRRWGERFILRVLD